jgi:predicted dehydrogenase
MIRLGVIGHGGRISNFIDGCMRPVAEEEIRVTGIVDPDEAGARSRLAECDDETVFYESVEELVRRGKPDGLMIGTRCNLHTPLAVEAAEFGLPLFLEKPVSITMAQALELERRFEAEPCPVLVSFPLRTSPLCVQARRLLDDGAVGERNHVTALNYVPYGTVYWEKPYRDYSITGGLFLQKATHDFDYLMFLMDSPIVRVSATASFRRVFGGDKPAGLTCAQCDERPTCPESPPNRRRNRSGGSLQDHPCLFGIDCGTEETGTNEDSSSSLLEFADGSHGAYVQVCYTRRDAGRRGAVVSGYEGTVEFDWHAGTLRRVRHHEPFTDTMEAAKGMSHFGGDEELALNFIGMMRSGEKPRATIRDGLRSVYACLAARDSLRSGKFEEVRQI